MDISTRSKDPGSTERTAQKRKFPSPPHSSNGHSPQDSSTSPIKKKKKPGLLNSSNKEQSELRHGPFYYMKQPLTTDPVDVVPQDGRNDFYCWVCHREGQVLCCELCPRVYHAKCLRLTSEPEGDWFCPECEKITVAECIETQSKAMTMLTIEQLSYLLKFAIQKMKQPGTDAFQKPVPLEQHPDYAEYIFHPMDLCTLEKNAKKKMYGCTEAFLADAKWILHNCIIYNGGNHKLTQIAKVVIKICEHEMNEIEVCPECYLAACQKRDNWFCEPCSNPHPLVWAKLKGFPFWPAKALRDKDGQVDARFFGQHDRLNGVMESFQLAAAPPIALAPRLPANNRAWVPINNCYLMSKEIPFSVKKTKSIFNSAMQEMEVYVENIRRKFGVFNYSPFRTPYTPNSQYQMLLDPSNPSAGTAKTDKQEKVKLNFDMTASPKILLSKPLLSGGAGRRISLSDMPRSPTSTNSSVHTGSDVEQDPEKKAPSSHFSASEESLDFLDKSTASPASTKTGQAGSLSGSPKPFSPQAPTPIMTKTDKTSTTGSILNLNLDRSKAEMDLKELSESVQQQSAPVPLISPKRQIRSRFQLNLDKTIESCKAQLGINEISEDVYTAVEHSDSEDSEKSESSDSEYVSDEEQKPKNEPEEPEDKEGSRVDKEAPGIKKKPKPANPVEVKEEVKSNSPASEKADPTPAKDKASPEPEKDSVEKAKPSPHPTKDKLKGKDDTDSPTVHLGLDSDSESELVIDLGEDPSGREGRKNKKEPKVPSPKQDAIGKLPPSTAAGNQSPPETPVLTRSATQAPSAGVTVAATTSTMSTVTVTAPATAVTGSPVKKQRPLLPKETAPAVQRVVWNSSSKFQTSSQKWHMQKIQRQQQQHQQQQQQQQQQQPHSSQGTRYQTRQAVKAVQQKEVTQSPSTSTITLVTSTQPAALVSSSGSASTLASAINADLPIATASADVAADIAKYTSKMMDAIKGTMTEIYNDLSKNTTGSTIAEIRRLRIEIEKLQWLHQQELAEMKHNLELTMAEMRQSLEQERDRLIAEVKKQLELEKQQAVDETKKKQWCANCKKEAIFYCCWNTSYCDYPCQQAHWPEHMKSCTQSATAPQQEADAEASTDTGNKSSQGSSSNAQSAPSETASASKEKETPAEKSKDSSTLDLSGSRETPSSILLGSNQGSVSKRCDKQAAYAPTTTDHQPHPNYPSQKYHSRSSKTGLWSSSEEKRGSARSEHSAGTSTKNLMPKESRESRLDTFWD
ncbi:protein kinase C-binding protein 1 isoform X4 [Cricetulus griseus]|nr:protein kinase C-binding protein 1 isoform X4 [Cricetulus griseus]XP_007639470.1 protein kinase C-binding protein 1 isoform X4 [Cricetulus griseus]XP_016830161.1 protein kinase C-binding protein 1 isoform X4 [Cricetulus griseus]XP_027279191.1 protein kinase C-binding protein 1 isoform X4 [Cricetulus griseus]XP_027279192.1 protein kinase C-binding protein 1 isoform X4 [Cricetulus griseus]XP_027279193.1 protein kinase C-binding protein 1 isoform X4 [Cricetulus griseus]